MEQRWKQLTADLCCPEIQQKWWTTIHGSLANSKQRKYYYNLQYLERRFNLFEQHRDRLSQAKAVSLAIFFSHLHYDPHIHGIAEELTLSTFREFASEAQLSSELDEEVTRLIEAAIANSTPVHLTQDAYGSDDLHFFLDFDTAVLGSSASDYADYAARMRDEYGFMSDHDYTQLRLKLWVPGRNLRMQIHKVASKDGASVRSVADERRHLFHVQRMENSRFNIVGQVLRCFLMIPNIFATKAFRDRYESQARENIAKEISTIQESSKS